MVTKLTPSVLATGKHRTDAARLLVLVVASISALGSSCAPRDRESTALVSVGVENATGPVTVSFDPPSLEGVSSASPPVALYFEVGATVTLTLTEVQPDKELDTWLVDSQPVTSAPTVSVVVERSVGIVARLIEGVISQVEQGDSVQDALDGLGDGDILELMPGVHTYGAEGDGLQFRGKAITMRSASGNPENTTVTIPSSGEIFKHVFLFDGAEGPETRVEGIRVTSLGALGPIRCEGSASPTFRNCTVENVIPYDQTGYGVLRVGTGTVRMDSCLIRNNTSTYVGGIVVEGGGLVLVDCVFRDNVGRAGGAVDASSGWVTAERCEFDGNEASGYDGGAIRMSASSALTDCIFRENKASGSGGAVYAPGAAGAEIRGCVFLGNTSGERGGGYFGKASLVNCVFGYNTAVEQGGGAYLNAEWDDPTPRVAGCTFAYNEAPGVSGLYLSSTLIPVSRSIVAFNRDGQGVSHGSWLDTLITCTDVYMNEGGDWNSQGVDDLHGNFSSDPEFCDAPSEDFRLLGISPCLDSDGCGLIGALGQCP